MPGAGAAPPGERRAARVPLSVCPPRFPAGSPPPTPAEHPPPPPPDGERGGRLPLGGPSARGASGGSASSGLASGGEGLLCVSPPSPRPAMESGMLLSGRQRALIRESWQRVSGSPEQHGLVLFTR